MKRNDDPKMWKQIATAPFVLMPDGPGRVVTVASSATATKKVKIAHTQIPELIPVLGSQPAGDVSHKPGGRLPLLSTRPTVTLTTLKKAATNLAAW